MFYWCSGELHEKSPLAVVKYNQRAKNGGSGWGESNLRDDRRKLRFSLFFSRMLVYLSVLTDARCLLRCLFKSKVCYAGEVSALSDWKEMAGLRSSRADMRSSLISAVLEFKSS